MGKYLIIYAILATVLLGSLWQSNRELEQDLANLHESIQNFNKAQKKTIQTVTEIREKVKYVKEPCNCYNTNIPDDILDSLYTN